MPYHKNKQQAFQAAEQGVEQARDVFESMDSASSDFGHHLKRLKQEINEAEKQIENAHEVASETQRRQLQSFQQEIDRLKQHFD